MTDRKRGRRVVARGVVQSCKMDKSIVVKVTRLIRHEKFHKFIQRSTKYYAHDAKNAAKVGDVVEIVETKPISRLKRWRLVKILSSSGELT